MVRHRPKTPRNGLRLVTACLASLVLALSLGVSTATATGFGQWHRNNYGAGHERLACNERSRVWVCAYGDADLNTTMGLFVGRKVTNSWSCPDWFASEICDPGNLVAVYQGATFYAWGTRVPQDYVVTNINGQDILYLYWRESNFGPFYCPWFRTFQEALAAPFACTDTNG
jgi:hypothetical protein